ncbi:hypothetical protein TNCV_5005871 [Trichonephila clavipes]|nr:hypothetical protein TNCV_5005871 [Trichonephila clavipes]
MARKRAENRERSLGFPGFVKPVFTKDSKPLGKRKKITRAPLERETRTHLKKQPPYIVLFRNTVSEHDAVLSHLQYVRKVVETDDLRNSPQSADSDVARNHRKKYVAHHRGDESLPFDRRCAVSRYVSYAIHQNDHQARRRFVEWAQNEIAVVPDFHKRILFSDEAHFWFNGYVNKQICCIWSEANPQVYVETPLHPEKLTVWCSLWAGGILLQKR